ncbi:glutamate dehydrogenase (NAD(P)+) [Caldibacillus thermoamylovorans]|uniref:Glu/Leu/Phe/Val family dehydrogenase n=1 Tax=Bacillaceae TaxID=186817 RepID=UPI0005B6F547|nr:MULTISPECIES: Glu/Leu/Phe/Val dehydrogenase dimerization domain-containing protein [Caldibacillus]KIO66646.1 glutamate dehydrogenase (NAD(P)+) [Caldibacillus thermoamylovorans]MCB7070195.1 Glu/Leu/Phe/Val dehydrogenase [Caldibacillus sp. 210928-DFI.2.22]MCB7073659.1 Glu/Leu/Phe/Val dehydrogenase [Caldibacillus sp. 210928-DFI.2.18]
MKQPYLSTEWIDPVTGAKGYLVIDEMKAGFCAGGIRMRKGVTKEEIQRLAEIMTIKMAGLGMTVGGAKGGIDFPPNDPKSKEVLKRYLEAHTPYIKECWLTSEDLGTREEDILQILSELGLNSSVQAFIDKQENAPSLLNELQKAMKARYDGTALTELVTGYGVSVVTIKSLEQLGEDPQQAKVSIQGFGSVGASAAKFLYESGIKVVAVADIQGTIYKEDGLDIPLLLTLKDSKGLICRKRLPSDYEQLTGSKWLEVETDVLIPAAIADVINIEAVDKIEAKIIVEGANLPVTKEAEEILFQRGILVIPDFIANSGGAGLFVSVLNGNVEGTPKAIFQFLGDRLSKTVEVIFSIVNKERILPRMAARQLVEIKEISPKEV